MKWVIQHADFPRSIWNCSLGWVRIDKATTYDDRNVAIKVAQTAYLPYRIISEGMATIQEVMKS